MEYACNTRAGQAGADECSEDAVVKLRGLPYDSSKDQIADFFQGRLSFQPALVSQRFFTSRITMHEFYTWEVRKIIFNLLCFNLFHNLIFWVLGLEIEHNGILLITDFSGRPTGEAFVQFTNVGDGKGALQKHKESMGHRFVGSHSNNNCLKARHNSNQYFLSTEKT